MSSYTEVQTRPCPGDHSDLHLLTLVLPVTLGHRWTAGNKWHLFTHFSVMSNSVTPWIVAHQAPLSMGFSGQGYWNGLPFLSPGDLPNQGIEPGSLAFKKDSLPSEPLGKVPFQRIMDPISMLNVS